MSSGWMCRREWVVEKGKENRKRAVQKGLCKRCAFQKKGFIAAFMKAVKIGEMNDWGFLLIPLRVLWQRSICYTMVSERTAVWQPTPQT